MSNKKTISQLNSKVWYRLLKVIYIIFILLLLLFFNAVVLYDVDTKNLDSTKTLIQCNYKDKKVFTAKSAYLNLSYSDFKNELFDYRYFFEGYNDNKIKTILQQCYDTENIDELDVFAIQRIYEIDGLNYLTSENNQKITFENGVSANFDGIPSPQDIEEVKKELFKADINKIRLAILTKDKIKYLDFNIHLFNIKPVFSYAKFVIIFIICNLSIIFAFELFRRLFYYIVLGNLRPKKN